MPDQDPIIQVEINGQPLQFKGSELQADPELAGKVKGALASQQAAQTNQQAFGSSSLPPLPKAPIPQALQGPPIEQHDPTEPTDAFRKLSTGQKFLATIGVNKTPVTMAEDPNTPPGTFDQAYKDRIYAGLSAIGGEAAAPLAEAITGGAGIGTKLLTGALGAGANEGARQGANAVPVGQQIPYSPMQSVMGALPGVASAGVRGWGALKGSAQELSQLKSDLKFSQDNEPLVQKALINNKFAAAKAGRDATRAIATNQQQINELQNAIDVIKNKGGAQSEMPAGMSVARAQQLTPTLKPETPAAPITINPDAGLSTPQESTALAPQEPAINPTVVGPSGNATINAHRLGSQRLASAFNEAGVPGKIYDPKSGQLIDLDLSNEPPLSQVMARVNPARARLQAAMQGQSPTSVSFDLSEPEPSGPNNLPSHTSQSYTPIPESATEGRIPTASQTPASGLNAIDQAKITGLQKQMDALTADNIALKAKAYSTPQGKGYEAATQNVKQSQQAVISNKLLQQDLQRQIDAHPLTRAQAAAKTAGKWALGGTAIGAAEETLRRLLYPGK